MEIEVIGSAQDAGIPWPGCSCRQCQKGISRKAPAILVHDKNRRILVDCPPDIIKSINLWEINAIILTHAHIGHYGGLFFLGREAYNTHRLPVYCSEKMKKWMVKGNKAYNHLVRRKNIIPIPFIPGELFNIANLKFNPIRVNHRDEDADTIGISINNGKNKFFYMPDLDFWTNRTINEVRDSDIAMIDGTFYSGKAHLSHPPILESMELFKNSNTEIYFTHLNHSNRVADPGSREYREVKRKGFYVAEDGMVLNF
ncbi:hypothetical protein AKJ66_04750 [candidate division MSBL1 archaeon SCGC-AAA259E22]|uniref:Metallo-beta-lactamase domain-containing protein n=1 Tax=candidate division MSBL1 archaeon SCGC-AAA259E22 TaxID=1698265 RepID=A0A133UD04_9EURY|nr:hypothetical protein AKJ66_04750 [candidate division MSBL1 archaeon SCGC-AAA259E22]